MPSSRPIFSPNLASLYYFIQSWTASPLEAHSHKKMVIGAQQVLKNMLAEVTGIAESHCTEEISLVTLNSY